MQAHEEPDHLRRPTHVLGVEFIERALESRPVDFMRENDQRVIRIDAFVDVSLEQRQGHGGIFRLHVSPGFGG